MGVLTIVYAAGLIGSAIFLLAVLDELVLVLRKEKPTYQLAEEARRAAGDGPAGDGPPCDGRPSG